MASVDRMVFGPSSLSRLECATCRETTLHKHNQCIHCGTTYAPPASSGVKPTWNHSNPRIAKRQ